MVWGRWSRWFGPTEGTGPHHRATSPEIVEFVRDARCNRVPFEELHRVVQARPTSEDDVRALRTALDTMPDDQGRFAVTDLALRLSEYLPAYREVVEHAYATGGVGGEVFDDHLNRDALDLTGDAVLWWFDVALPAAVGPLSFAAMVEEHRKQLVRHRHEAVLGYLADPTHQVTIGAVRIVVGEVRHGSDAFASVLTAWIADGRCDGAPEDVTGGEVAAILDEELGADTPETAESLRELLVRHWETLLRSDGREDRARGLQVMASLMVHGTSLGGRLPDRLVEAAGGEAGRIFRAFTPQTGYAPVEKGQLRLEELSRAAMAD